MSVDRFYAYCFLATTIMCVVILAIVIDDDGPDPTPLGCAWVDVNPSKSADYRLACAEGYEVSR